MVAYPSTMTTNVDRPPSLLEATTRSTTGWQQDLKAIFDNAKEYFPDVVWELSDDNAGSSVEEIWGHKAIVYSRAPPSFQARYFSFRPAPVASPISPIPYTTSPTPGQSALSLPLDGDYAESSRTPSPYRVNSPTPSNSLGSLLRLPITMNPIMFSNELEYLYTGKGFGAAFEFLFDTAEKRLEGDAEENRIDQLRKDLVFMWRSRLYSDVRIALTGNITPSHEDATAIFSSHRFILVARSPYFYSQLITFASKNSPEHPLTLNLPSPPFTPASLHFTLGFLYTGTLNFSNRTFDLETSFHIIRSALYISSTSLINEIQARIVQEMMHGLFHAFLEFSEYERITGGKWGTGGCKCRQCARRAPRVLEFAVSEDVKNQFLERGARRALVGLFGEGWCTPEFATLPQKTKDGLLKGLAKRTTPMNVFPLLFAAQAAMTKLTNTLDEWADAVREMVLSARKCIDETLCGNAEKCFELEEWNALMENDGSRFEDGEQVQWVMESILRGLNEKNAGAVYQILVSSILLRPHPTEAGETLLSSISQIRIQVEDTRMDVIRWLRRRWAGVRQEGGFDNLESWALKEISYEIDVPIEELVSPTPPPNRSPATPRTGVRASATKHDGETDAASVMSLRANVLHRNLVKTAVAAGDERRDGLSSSATSIRSIARSVASTTSKATASTVGPSTPRKRIISGDNESISTHSVIAPSVKSSAVSAVSTHTGSVLAKSSASSANGRRLITRPTVDKDSSPLKSSAASVISVRSHTSTLRKPNPASSSKVPSPSSRPTSSATTSTLATSTSDASTFRTAPESVTRVRRVSATSTVSVVSTRNAKSPVPPVPKVTRPRRNSAASATSRNSVATIGAKRPVAKDVSNSLLAPPGGRSPSGSTRSSTSTSTAVTRASVINRKSSTGKEDAPPTPPQKDKVLSNVPENTSSSITIKGKTKIVTSHSKDKTSHQREEDVTTPTTSILKRKESNDTITAPVVVLSEPTREEEPRQTAPPAPRGSTLDIGIPCIVSSKRKRFKAFARYIGEVEGELGSWVGVEVPVNENWNNDTSGGGPQWNDGTWGGIRYFEIGTGGSDWGDEDRAARRRRVELHLGSKGLKREGDQLSVDRSKRLRSVSPAVSDVSGMSSSECRGLFIRPQQVLYVVDAVGSD